MESKLEITIVRRVKGLGSRDCKVRGWNVRWEDCQGHGELQGYDRS